MPPSVALVEDHGLIAHSLGTALSAADVAVTVVDPLRTDDLLAALVAVAPDLVLLDLDLGTGGRGDDLIAPLCEAGAIVLVVTGVDDPLRRRRCLRAGAAGVVDKSVSFDELVAAIERALAEGALLSRDEREEQLAQLRRHEHEQAQRLAPFDELSHREAEVLGELMRGRSVDEIARDAVVSVSTVRTQVRAILSKLRVGSQLAAIGKARDAGWTAPQER